MSTIAITNKIYLFLNDTFGKQVVDIFKQNSAKVSAIIFIDDAEPSYKDYVLSTLPHDQYYSYSDLLADIELKQMTFDLGILAWWPHIIPQDLIDKAQLGILNFHPSLLPWGRGKNPNFWTFVDETPFGATIHWVDSKIDNGAIAYQQEIYKTWEDNGESLYLKSREALLIMLATNFQDIYNGKIPKYYKKLNTSLRYSKELADASQVDLNKEYKAAELLDLLRARTFKGYPACWFEENNDIFEVRVSITKRK